MTRVQAGMAVVALVLALAGPALWAGQRSPDVELRAAIETETVRGDIAAAIEQYKRLIDAHGKTDRAVAAQALLRLAEVYQKLGDAQARAAYERLVREFGDQRAAVETARQRLALAPRHQATPVLTTTRVLDVGRAHDRVSPDGRFLARIDNRTENLVLLDLATGASRPLTSDGRPEDPDHRFPLATVFSRDGRRIAYQWYTELNDHTVLRSGSTSGPSTNPRILFDSQDATIAPTDWSPDGRWIAGVIRRADRTAQIGVVSAADGALRVLKTVDWSRVGGLRFSPDSSMLAYHRPSIEGGFERDVYAVAVDGSRETVVAASPGDDTVLEWTPDGERVLIASDRGGSMSVWSVPWTRPAGPGSFTLVKSDVGIISSLGPTRDGTLFYHLLPSSANIFVADVDVETARLTSTPVQPIQQFKGVNAGARWSSDGQHLAFGSRRDIPSPINTTRFTVSMLSMVTGHIEREVHPQLSYGGVGQWSADGKQFLVRGADLKGRSGILSVDATTGDTRLVVPNETCSGIPSWAPDGVSFFCYRAPDFNKSKTSEIAQVHVATGEVLRTYPAESQVASVSPDGRYAVIHSRPLKILNLATGEIRLLMPQTGTSRTGNMGSIDWTPDGRHVSFYGTLNGQEGMWLAPVDGGPPRRIHVDIVQPILQWHFNPKTRQVAFSTDNLGGRLELWKLTNFLSAPPTAAR